MHVDRRSISGLKLTAFSVDTVSDRQRWPEGWQLCRHLGTLALARSRQGARQKRFEKFLIVSQLPAYTMTTFFPIILCSIGAHSFRLPPECGILKFQRNHQHPRQTLCERAPAKDEDEGLGESWLYFGLAGFWLAAALFFVWLGIPTGSLTHSRPFCEWASTFKSSRCYTFYTIDYTTLINNSPRRLTITHSHSYN
jgi:hypothetical protein